MNRNLPTNKVDGLFDVYDDGSGLKTSATVAHEQGTESPRVGLWDIWCRNRDGEEWSICERVTMADAKAFMVEWECPTLGYHYFLRASK